MLLLLRLNYINIKYTQKELIKLGFNIAQSKLEVKDIAEWIIDHKI
jgi:death-on-curing protein